VTAEHALKVNEKGPGARRSLQVLGDLSVYAHISAGGCIVSNPNLKGRKHPDHEFLFEVAKTPDGKPIYTSKVYVKKAVGHPDKENESGQTACIRTLADSRDSEY
jgi:hypothetical protein